MKARLTIVLREAKVTRLLLATAARKLELQLHQLPRVEAEIKRLRRLVGFSGDLTLYSGEGTAA